MFDSMHVKSSRRALTHYCFAEFVKGTSSGKTLWKAAASAVVEPEAAYTEISHGTYGIMKQLGKKPWGSDKPWRIVFILRDELFVPCNHEGYVCKHRGAKDKKWCGCSTEVRAVSD